MENERETSEIEDPIERSAVIFSHSHHIPIEQKLLRDYRCILRDSREILLHNEWHRSNEEHKQHVEVMPTQSMRIEKCVPSSVGFYSDRVEERLDNSI